MIVFGLDFACLEIDLVHLFGGGEGVGVARKIVGVWGGRFEGCLRLFRGLFGEIVGSVWKGV